MVLLRGLTARARLVAVRAAAASAAALMSSTVCELDSCKADSSKESGGFRSAVLSLRPSAFGQRMSATDDGTLSAAKIVIFGEVHAATPCIEMECSTAETMLAEGTGRLHIVLEQCNFEHVCGFESSGLLAQSPA